MSCPPRFATRRRTERESFGHELAAIAEKLGQPFMPWQRYVADVGCEIDPVSGLPAYREVRVTIPRQSGKTTLFLSWQINRCVSRRWAHPQRSAFTAQTGKDARDKWIDELFPLIRNSPLKTLVAGSVGGRLSINEGMGNESIKFKTGSIIRLLSTSTTSGHSKTLHQAVMDEVWHDTDDRREQGLRPAMITVRDAQLLVCSTAGTGASLVLNRKVETGRQAVEDDTGSGVAYFEWSAAPGWRPDDEAGFFTFSPALCPDPPCRCAPPGEGWKHTITLEALRAERAAMDLPEFLRAYGNIPSGAEVFEWQVVSEDDWTRAEDAESQAKDPLILALDVTPERTHAAIAIVGPRADGHVHGEVIEHRPGTAWVAARVLELVKRWKPYRVVVDPGGAAGSLIPELTHDLVPQYYEELALMKARDVAHAYGLFHQHVSSDPDSYPVDLPADAPAQVPGRRLRVRPHPALTAAVRGVATRRIGDGTTWNRKSPAVDISPLVALTNALHAFAARPAPPSPGYVSAPASGASFFARNTERLKI